MKQGATSFRDPAGFCILLDDRVLRVVNGDGVASFEVFLQTRSAREWLSRRRLVSTRRLNEAEATVLFESAGFQELIQGRETNVVFEHERIPFANYPHEWPPEMLWAAGRLTLELALGSLADGYGLKDATPFNVMFRGSEPVFIDLLSFEKRRAGDPLWKPYAQFVRTFLLPLLAAQRWNLLPADIFFTHRDGLEPEDVYRLCGPLARFSPKMLSLVSIPTWLSRSAKPDDENIYREQTIANPEKARFILESQLKRLNRTLNALKPDGRKNSAWSDYMTTNSYAEPEFVVKEQFVHGALTRHKPLRVLDVGANTGHFSELAAKAGASVVAIDFDPACVGAIWSRAGNAKVNVLPLVVNLSRPTPAMGWRNGECLAFLDRAKGAFDCVLMLAVIHHLLVTERIPLNEILKLASELTTSLLIIEFVGPEDRMFRKLTRGRGDLHSSLTQAAFEQACNVHFEILESLPIQGTKRLMYCLKKKGAHN